MNLDLIFGPDEIHLKNHLAEKTAVVVDVLRATTTITTACQNGCSSIRPVLTPEKAFQEARALAGKAVILGGERGGLKVAGFDLGNSPREYGEDRVKNKQIIFTSTNCTKIIHGLTGARRIVICSFLNVSAVAQQLAQEGSDVLIACAGLKGLFSLEDTCCAGMLVGKLRQLMGKKLRLRDTAIAAEILFNNYKNDLLQMLRQSEWGRKIVRLGLEQDLVKCAKVDETTIVPEMIGKRIVVPRPA
ncbi:MAG: 2-phosphosulfolactate phosphatase [Candidatus Binatia bacterium]